MFPHFTASHQHALQHVKKRTTCKSIPPAGAHPCSPLARGVKHLSVVGTCSLLLRQLCMVAQSMLSHTHAC